MISFQILSWFLNNMFSKLCGYGEKSGRVLLSWLVVILFFGTFYWITDSLTGISVNNVFDNYYFSVINFTTLGLGDIHPDPSNVLGKIAAMTEALIGAFMMALFVLVFGRKMTR